MSVESTRRSAVSIWRLLRYAVYVAVTLYVGLTAGGAAYDQVFPGPFAPLEPRQLVIENPVVTDGTLVARDGVCNRKKQPVEASYYGYVQRQDGDAKDAVYVLGSKLTPRPLTVYPGCAGTQPTRIDLPSSLAPGRYLLTIVIDVKGPQGQQQHIVRPSPEFTVAN